MNAKKFSETEKIKKKFLDFIEYYYDSEDFLPPKIQISKQEFKNFLLLRDISNGLDNLNVHRALVQLQQEGYITLEKGERLYLNVIRDKIFY